MEPEQLNQIDIHELMKVTQDMEPEQLNQIDIHELMKLIKEYKHATQMEEHEAESTKGDDPVIKPVGTADAELVTEVMKEVTQNEKLTEEHEPVGQKVEQLQTVEHELVGQKVEHKLQPVEHEALMQTAEHKPVTQTEEHEPVSQTVQTEEHISKAVNTTRNAELVTEVTKEETQKDEPMEEHEPVGQKVAHELQTVEHEPVGQKVEHDLQRNTSQFVRKWHMKNRQWNMNYSQWNTRH